MIRIHVPCLEELTSAMLCNHCKETVTGDEISFMVSLYSIVSRYYQSQQQEVVKAYAVITDQTNKAMKGMNIDDQLRYQLGVYKKHLGDDYNETE